MKEMDKNLLAVGLVGLLLVVSVFQAFQLSGLNDNIKSASVAAQTAAATVAPVKTQASAPSSDSGTGAKLPSNLQNLPQMVGGC